MFMLLLAAAVPAVSVPVTPRVKIAFSKAGSVTVTAPENKPRNTEYPWRHEQTLMSPRRDAAAVRFCWEIGKHEGCQVVLARPGQPTQQLKKSDVRRLLWTPDGQYLIGAGANTVRLWNLVGAVRTHVPQLKPDQLSERIRTREITRLWLEQGHLCVAQLSDVFGASGGYALRQVLSTTRYRLPTLSPLEVVGLPAAGNLEAPCSMPHSESQSFQP